MMTFRYELHKFCTVCIDDSELVAVRYRDEMISSVTVNKSTFIVTYVLI